jgi:hypothetical protein
VFAVCPGSPVSKNIPPPSLTTLGSQRTPSPTSSDMRIRPDADHRHPALATAVPDAASRRNPVHREPATRSSPRSDECSSLTQRAKLTQVQESLGGCGNKLTLMPVMLTPTLTKMPAGMANRK